MIKLTTLNNVNIDNIDNIHKIKNVDISEKIYREKWG